MNGTPFNASSILRVGVVGTGVIGSSWVLLFLLHGLKVVVTDPALGAEEKLKQFLDSQLAVLREAGRVAEIDLSNYEFVTDINPRLPELDFIQENGPERLDLKTEIIANLDANTREDAIIASSSSGLASSQFIGKCSMNSSRVLVAHPFNPPHLVPLVEIVPHPGTAEGVIEAAMSFYRALGKHPVRLQREVPGFVANRLQTALNYEAFSLVSRGIVSAEDLDTCLTSGPGLRWAAHGPFLINSLGGGGGYNGFQAQVAHLGPARQRWFDDMQTNKFEFGNDSVVGLLEQAEPWVSRSDAAELRRQQTATLLQLLDLQGHNKLKLV